MIEEWRPWRDGAYEVSSLGRVRRAKPGRRTFTGRQLTLVLMKVGYFCVRPVVEGRNVQMCVHAMVAECFLGPRPDGFDVNHIDGVKTNNSVSNLEYVSHGDNMRHAFAMGLAPRGERHGHAKLTDDQVREIRARRASGEPGSVLAKAFGVSPSTISQIASGKSRRAA